MKKKNRKLVEIMKKKEVDPISMTRLFHLTACSNYTGEVMTSFSSVPSITFCSAHLRYISGFHKLSMHTAYTPPTPYVHTCIPEIQATWPCTT